MLTEAEVRGLVTRSVVPVGLLSETPETGSAWDELSSPGLSGHGDAWKAWVSRCPGVHATEPGELSERLCAPLSRTSQFAELPTCNSRASRPPGA